MTATLQDLKPSQIKPHKSNPRHDVGDVTELAASIKEQGILEPLLVAPNGAGATYVLLAGHRRLAAAKTAKCKTVPCIVRDDITDPAAQLEAMLVENLQRTDLSPVEEAEAYQQLLEFPGYTQKRITETTGRAAATVRARLKLAKLPDATRAKVHTGQITLADAQSIAEFADDDDAVKQLTAAVGTYNFNWTVERLRRDRAAARKTAAAVKQLEEEGVRLWTSAELNDLEQPEDSAFDPWAHVLDPGDERYEPGEDVPIAPADHSDCPGHGAIIDHAGDLFYVCVEPHRHSDLLEQAYAAEQEFTEEEKQQRAALAARDAAAAQLHDDLAVAAKVRRRHFGDHAAAVGAEYAASILRARILEHARGYYAPQLADVLLPDRADDTNLAAQIEATVQKISSLDHLAALLDVADNLPAEGNLERTWGWPAGGGASYGHGTREWRDRARDVWGYEFSEVERRMSTVDDDPAGGDS